MTFTHLHIQSGYSLMKSTIKINPLVERAKKLGYQSLALTDDQTMSGIVSFYQSCKRNGIRPILGMKIYIHSNGERFTTILLAKNNTGYQNLLNISSLIHIKQKPIQMAQIASYTEGLIAILMTSESPWVTSIKDRDFATVTEGLQEWYSYFSPRDIYLSIVDVELHLERQLHQPLKDWSEHNNIPVVAIGDVNHLYTEDAEAYHCLRAISEDRKLPEDFHENDHQYLKSPEEMEALFKEWWPEVLENTSSIAEQCHVQIPLDQQLIPSYPTPNGKKARDFLRQLCEEALNDKYGSDNKDARERLEHELNVIVSMNFSDYFLIVWDFISYARKQGIHAGPGRGSAAGSIVAYLLDITEVDPLAYHLLFERFLNPERVSMPDIDIDFPDHRRDEVITYVAKKYGSSHVAQICTFGTFAARSVLREIFKVMEVDENDASFILKHIPTGSTESLVKIVQKSSPLKEYIKESAQLQRVFHSAVKLEGLPRHISTHAAGIIISQQPLVKYTALTQGQGDVYLTQLAMGDLEKIGLLKMDFLGLRNLTFIEKIERKIIDYKNADFAVEKIPLNDASTFSLLQEGRTNGVFQLESQGMKGVLKRLRPTRFEDVVAVNALYRPGPMEYIPTYINRKHNKELVQYPHPDVKSILKDTFGVLVYQEQIMQVAQKVAGYTLGEADLLRRAVSKKQAQILEEQRELFVAGSQRQGYKPQIANELFDWIVKFSNYGFNRSHAVAYSLISYRLAFMKAHFPSYFLAEVINTHVGDRDKLAMYIREARDLEVEVKAPSVNDSHVASHDEHGAIRMGLIIIKGVGVQAAQAIINERRNGYFRHLNDFCLRVPTNVVTRSVLESLILAGGFDELQPNRAHLLSSIDQALEQGELFKEFQNQPSLFDAELEMEGSKVEIEPFPVLKKLAMEKEVIGTYVSDHPLEFQRSKLRERGLLSIYQIFNINHKKQVKVVGVIESIKEIRTKRGESMAFATISDETSEMDTVFFPDLYRTLKPWIIEQMIIVLEGKVDERRGRKQLLASSVSRFEGDQVDTLPDQRLFIKVSEVEEQKAINQLKRVAEYFPGNTPILIFRAEDRKTYQLGGEFSLITTRECLNMLKDFFGSSSVAIRSNPVKSVEKDK